MLLKTVILLTLRKSVGSAFHNVGADTLKARSHGVFRVVLGTFSVSAGGKLLCHVLGAMTV